VAHPAGFSFFFFRLFYGAHLLVPLSPDDLILRDTNTFISPQFENTNSKMPNPSLWLKPF
jgi:hypothetical protein